MADAKQAEVNSGSSQARVVLAKPRLGGFASSSFGASSSSTESNSFGLGPVLRPPQLKPGNNPFLKVTNINEPENEKRNEIKPSKSGTEEDKEAPKFVPLGSTNVTPRTNNPVSAPGQTATSSSASFVFGQNLSERVVIKENLNNGEATIEHSSTNGTSELLFTSAAASVKEGNQEESVTNETSRSGEGLAAAAAEYERSHARPPPPPSNAVTMTGEEGENNVLQISCRLYAWEAGSWRERGRGVLRLNDAAAEGGAARLVARVAGSLRVVLNTKLWPDMVVEMAGTKSLRITAADAQQQVKLYLIMGAPGDIVQLHRALMARVASSKPINSSVSKHNATSQRAAERLEAATDDSEYIDRSDSEEVSNNATITEQSENFDEEVDKVDSLECDRIDQKTEEDMLSVDNGTNEDTENRPLKRKEPAETEMSPKRQCSEV